jgi:hypothetical protein
MNFDDPQPPSDKRVMQLIYLRPSLKDRIDNERGRQSRSEWIEGAIKLRLAREHGEIE